MRCDWLHQALARVDGGGGECARGRGTGVANGPPLVYAVQGNASAVFVPVEGGWLWSIAV